MAIGLLPAISAIGAGYGLLKSAFKKKPEYNIPTFFGNDYLNKVSAIKQARQAQYGTGLTDIRDALANSGMLNPAATTDAYTRFGIAKGADIAGAESEAYSSELDQQRTATIDKNKIDFEAARSDRGDQLKLLTQFASSVGKLTGSKNKDGEGGEENTEDEYIITTDKDGGESWVKNPSYQSGSRKILKVLLGI